MGEIRSSWEIAQEKAGRLGNLSAEEIKQQKETLYRNTAFAAVKEYLEGRNFRYMEREMDKYAGEDRELMKRMMLYCLIEAIDLNGDSVPAQVLSGITALYPGERTGRLLDEAGVLSDKYRDSCEDERRRMKDNGMEMLRKKGISGSAICIAGAGSGPVVPNDIVASFKKELDAIGKKIAG